MKLEQLMEDVPFTLVQGTLETEIEDSCCNWIKDLQCLVSCCRGTWVSLPLNR